MMRARTTLAILLVGVGCRTSVDDATDAAPAELRLTVTGHGAITGPGIGCATDCRYVQTGPVELTATPAEAWTFDHFDPPCGADPRCFVPLGAELHATFVQTPLTANRVFVSSAPAVLGSGRAGLDAQCQTLADGAQLGGVFVALVSTTTQDARDRLAGSRGWVRLDGLPILDLPEQLGAYDSSRGVVLDERRQPHGRDFVLTGSDGTGRYAGASCSDWTATNGPVDGGLADAAFHYLAGTTSSSCSGALYCFELGRTQPVALVQPPFPVGRFVFVTDWEVGGGIASADARCQTDATAAGLPGTYKALLATTAESAAQHVGSLAGVWRRADGALVTTSGLDRPPFDVHLAMTTSKAPFNRDILLGAASLMTTATAATSCTNWSNSAGTSTGVEPWRNTVFDQVFFPYVCNQGWGIACVQTP